jgi:ChAPs (Chs5p-Arf1p-binding proteins)
VKFCCFDAITRTDVHLTFHFPGQMSLSAFHPSQPTLTSLDDIEWNNVYLSSCIRSMNPERANVVMFYREFESIKQLDDLLSLCTATLMNKYPHVTSSNQL